MESIKMTLETLYDILRNEKRKEDLQKLEGTFFFDVISYFREKKALLDSRQNENDLFAAGEKEKLEYEVRSIKRILKEIYEKREKKVMDIAINRSRTGSDIIDTSAMLREEKEFYQHLLVVLDGFRQGVLMNLFKGELPELPASPGEKKKEEIRAELEAGQSTFPQFANPPEKTSAEIKPPLAKIRFVHPVPSFVWKDLKVYGPFQTGESTEIFPEVADLLVRKGRAEKVS